MPPGDCFGARVTHKGYNFDASGVGKGGKGKGEGWTFFSDWALPFSAVCFHPVI